MDNIKNYLLDKLKNTNPKGLTTSIKKTKPDIYNFLNDHKTKHNLTSISESIYWIINDLSKKPVCSKYCDKCIYILKFISIKEGYKKACSKCIYYTIEYKKNLQNSIEARYGVDNIAKLKSTQEKRKQTSLKKYGTESPNQSELVKKKKKETLLKNFGEEGLSHSLIKEKKKQTCLQKYGTEHHTKLQSVQDKRKDTCQKKYGTDNVMKVKSISDKMKNSLIDIDQFLNYADKLCQDRNLILDKTSYNGAFSKVKVTCKTCNHQFQIIWNSLQQGQGVCQQCYPLKKGVSKAEKDIADYIKSFDLEIIENSKSIITPYELDIVIPELKLAIEYCGLWCHSTGGTHILPVSFDDYHLNKLNLCNNKDYQLITIFEDEYLGKPDVVKSILKLKLGRIENKLFARKCTVKQISYKDKHEFLNNYHLQGDTVSSINLGLYYHNELVSVMTFKKLKDNNYELARFCNIPDTIINGAASKLLAYFETNYQWSDIITYADRRWSVGNLYYQLGFTFKHNSKPNYWYWGKDIKGRKHRLNYNKNKLKHMKNYNEELTEKQIMCLEGYNWIHDCGNMVFEKRNLI